MLCDITAAFLHNPPIIFLDEPTIGLDVSIKNKIRQFIRDLNKKKGTTILLTTHDISDIEALCKRIIIIDKGKIIYNDNIQKVKKLFGAYRTLKLNLEKSEESKIQNFKNVLTSKFLQQIEIGQDLENNKWLCLIFNQDKINLIDIINFSSEYIKLKDIKIEEVSTEDVIRKIYEGKLG